MIKCAQCEKEMPNGWADCILVDETDKVGLDFCGWGCLAKYAVAELAKPDGLAISHHITAPSMDLETTTTSCDSGTFSSENPWVLA